MFSKILLAVDGSNHAAKATDVAGELAAQCGATVTVLHVHEHEIGRVGTIDLEAPDEAKECVDRATKALAEKGVATKSLLVRAQRSKIANVINERATEDGSELIALGTRGLSDASSMLLGSVAHDVLRHAPCPVLVCR